MNRLILFFFILLLTASSALAIPQATSEDREKSWGKPIETYQIEPGLMMMMTRDSQGKLLDAIVQGAVVPHLRSDAISVETSPIYLNLTKEKFEELIDRLVPPEERGKRINADNELGFCADICVSNYSYEHVVISSIWNVKWRDSNEPFSPLRSGPSRIAIHWKR